MAGCSTEGGLCGDIGIDVFKTVVTQESCRKEVLTYMKQFAEASSDDKNHLSSMIAADMVFLSEPCIVCFLYETVRKATAETDSKCVLFDTAFAYLNIKYNFMIPTTLSIIQLAAYTCYLFTKYITLNTPNACTNSSRQFGTEINSDGIWLFLSQSNACGRSKKEITSHLFNRLMNALQYNAIPKFIPVEHIIYHYFINKCYKAQNSDRAFSNLYFLLRCCWKGNHLNVEVPEGMISQFRQRYRAYSERPTEPDMCSVCMCKTSKKQAKTDKCVEQTKNTQTTQHRQEAEFILESCIQPSAPFTSEIQTTIVRLLQPMPVMCSLSASSADVVINGADYVFSMTARELENMSALEDFVEQYIYIFKSSKTNSLAEAPVDADTSSNDTDDALVINSDDECSVSSEDFDGSNDSDSSHEDATDEMCSTNSSVCSGNISNRLIPFQPVYNQTWECFNKKVECIICNLMNDSHLKKHLDGLVESVSKCHERTGSVNTASLQGLNDWLNCSPEQKCSYKFCTEEYTTNCKRIVHKFITVTDVTSHCYINRLCTLYRIMQHNCKHVVDEDKNLTDTLLGNEKLDIVLKLYLQFISEHQHSNAVCSKLFISVLVDRYNTQVPKSKLLSEQRRVEGILQQHAIV